jgi:endonuclease/exonuclease/phosphatase family metal-dependent hydrolase
VACELRETGACSQRTLVQGFHRTTRPLHLGGFALQRGFAMASRNTLKLATCNVNGIATRLPHLLEWLQEAKPDVVALQELKAADEAFPVGALPKQKWVVESGRAGLSS